MKKLMLMAAMVLSSLGISAADEVTAKVTGTNLNIGLENETSFVAFQMDIQLPEGVTAASITKTGRLAQGDDVTINGEATATPFVVAYNTLDGNILRVIAYNLGNNAISDATGDILKIVLSADIADPSQIVVSNIKFVTSKDLAEMDLVNVVAERGGIAGDINSDGKVDVADLSAIVKIMLKDDTTGLDVAGADVNGDGKVDVADLSSIVNIILK